MRGATWTRVIWPRCSGRKPCLRSLHLTEATCVRNCRACSGAAMQEPVYKSAVELAAPGHRTNQVQYQADRKQAGEVMQIAGGRDLDNVETNDLALTGDTCQEVAGFVVVEA